MGEEDANLFLNYWNLNQTFFLKGKTTVAHFENFKVVLAKRSLHATIVEETGPLSVNILNIESSKQEMKDLKVRGFKFSLMLDALRLQLRYSILALLSENKVYLFNPSLIKLIHSLGEKGWNNSD